ncbi:MAG: AEC family transporter [Clostridia bacterium]|nr:AEC family transporter [Clostridia bacterium]
MTVFLSTLNQMAFLMLLISIGFLLLRCKVISADASALLSKLENNVFIPALVLGTFMGNFTVEKMSVAWQFVLCGLVVVLITIPIAILFARITSKDDYIRKIYTYGLSFANFGFMGNAVVKALFPEVFMEYLIFVLPFWFFIYIWGVPSLLISSENSNEKFVSKLKNLVNPMFIAMFVGMIIGLLDIKMPSFIDSAVTTLGDCMSPIAMLLTGITIAKIDLRKTFKNISVYTVSVIRLLIIPLASVGILALLPLSYELALCTVCSLAMPLGLNTIVVPSAYGKDTSVAAGMALISHLLSCLTIPLVFMIFNIALK